MQDTAAQLLRDLVAFPTVSRDGNRDLLLYVEAYLRRHGVASEILWAPEGDRGNLWATIGPAGERGVILSGHTDVVPVDGQNWTSDPFQVREPGDGRLYGRGVADMKGFVALSLALVPELLRRDLKAPVHFAFSYDEEIGCVGVRSLVEKLGTLAVKPALCIVGEPTLMQPIVAHKGGRSYRVSITGRAVHSSLTPLAVNAIEVAAELIQYLKSIATDWRQQGPFDGEFDVPHSTLSVGLIRGGAAINISAEHCEFVFEFRHLASLDADALMRRVEDYVRGTLLPAMHKVAPESGIVFEPLYFYPGLDMAPEHPAVTFVKQLAGRNDHAKVAFGTEAGHFHRTAGIASVVIGPGAIAQAHKPDEWIEISQLDAGERFLARLLDRLVEAPLAF